MNICGSNENVVESLSIKFGNRANSPKDFRHSSLWHREKGFSERNNNKQRANTEQHTRRKKTTSEGEMKAFAFFSSKMFVVSIACFHVNGTKYICRFEWKFGHTFMCFLKDNE